jgi:ABC-2 type transport system ATP-binding protein
MQVLVCSDLKKTYDGTVEAVKGIDLVVNEGEIFGFLGPNGAGKSTSISMFVGLIQPTKGTLKILNYEIPKQSKLIHDRIGYVPQNIVIFEHLTVNENLSLFASSLEIEKANQKIKEVSKLVEIDKLHNRRVTKLSGGQRRRLNLAIGLLNNPDLLILDEPSAGMDPQSRQILWNTLRKLQKEKMITIILTTHLMEVADIVCDRIAIIDHGKIRVIDTPAALKSNFGKGDILKITFSTEVTSIFFEEFLQNFNVLDYKISSHEIEIRLIEPVKIIPTLINKITEMYGPSIITNIDLRKSTLEDVFIEITGHKLREK